MIYVTVHGLPARFWGKVEIRERDSCWPWKAGRDPEGYGAFWIDGATRRAPRVAWSITHERPIPDGLIVRHTCDNPPCVNPHHLVLGEPRDNDRDRVERGRSATGDRNGSRKYPDRLVRGPEHHGYRPDTCRNGHPAHRRYVSPSGERICRDCAAERRRRYRAKAKEEGRRAW